ncbi:hypothetical protein GCM10020358_06030 [Amorphoplanes nipponensis]|uniref:Uncharacterized protein n=1 Tax=Actinoplanes nipponensis TaxID=135950 RepID=A0A919MM55_9ACTN|nr:hypothetical protein Ani05nite_37450 [Actinoplanes nipponensis]
MSFLLTRDTTYAPGHGPMTIDGNFPATEALHPLCPSSGVVKLLHARLYRPLPPWQAIGARTYFRQTPAAPSSDGRFRVPDQIQRPPSHIRADQSV